MASVIMITRDSELQDLTRRLVSEGLGITVVSGYPDALRRSAEFEGTVVVVLDFDLPRDEFFDMYKLLHKTRPVPTLVLMPDATSWQFTKDSNSFPLDDYASKSASHDEIILRLKAMMLRAGYRLPEAPSPARAPETPPETDESRAGESIAVFSVKGGVGKTTIAVNLAVGLAKLYQARTLIVDADLWFGDVGILLNVGSGASVWDLCEKDEPDIVALRKAVVQHESGVWVLLRPWDVTSVEKMDMSRIPAIIQLYQTMFDYVIVDMQPTVDELNLQILDSADRILLVTTPEISATANSSRFLQIGGSLGYSNKTSLIVNRANFGIGLEHIEEQLKTPVAGHVVSAGHKVVDASTRGTSLFVLDPDQKDQVTRDMAGIAEVVAGRPSTQKAQSKKWLGGLVKRSASEPKAQSKTWMGSPVEAGG